MAKHKQTAGEQALSFLAMIVLAIGFVVVMIINAMSNLFSVSAFVDYGPGVWFDNIVSFQFDQTYQATRDLPVYADAAISSLDGHPLFVIPEGHLFKMRGDRSSEEVTYLAVQVYDGIERKTGFAIVEKTQIGAQESEDTNAPKYVGVLRSSHESFPIMSSATSFYIPTEEDKGISSALHKNLIDPAKAQDLQSTLSIRYASTAFDKEKVKKSDEWITVKEFTDTDRLAYIPASDKSVYSDIQQRYANGHDMALHQINPTFDAVAAIRAGIQPEVPSYGIYKIAGIGIVALLLISVAVSASNKRGRIACPKCGHKSHDHKVVQEKEWERYKHQTKSGAPDGRYKNNPIITTTARVYNCDTCEEAFRHDFTTG